MWAALKGDLEMVKYLVKKGADVSKKGFISDDTYGNYIYGNITGLAIAKKDLKMVKYLIEDCGIDINDIELDPETMKETGWSLFDYAAIVKDTLILSYLIEKGVVIRDLFSLIYASMPESMILKYKKIDSTFVSKKHSNGETILMAAILRGYNRFSKLLVRSTTNPEDLYISDKEGRNSLFYAVFMNNHDLIQEILSKSTIVEKKDNYGRTAIFIAVHKGNLKSIRLLEHAGMNMNSIDNNGMTPLMYAIQKRCDSVIIDFLLSKSTNIDTQDKDGRTALFYAIDNNDISTTKSLMKFGASINLPDHDGYYPLYFSIFRMKPKIAEILIKEGASFKTPNSNYESICQLAQRRGYKSFIKILDQCHDTIRMTNPLLPYLQIPKGHSYGIGEIKISNDGKYLVTSSADKTILIRELQSGKEIRNIAPGNYCNNMSFSKDRNQLLFESGFSHVILWDVISNSSVVNIPYYNLSINAVSFCQNDKAALVCGSTRGILHTDEKRITHYDSLINPSLLVNKSIIGVWDFEQNKLTSQFIYNGQVANAVYSASTNCVYASTKEGKLITWNLVTNEKRTIFHDSTITFRNISLSPDENSILTTTYYPLDLLIHNLPNGELIHKIPNVNAVWAKPTFGKDENEIIYMTFEDIGNERHYSMKKVLIDNGEVIDLMNFSQNQVNKCFIYPEKSILFTTSSWRSSDINIYDYSSQEITRELLTPVNRITGLDFSVDKNAIGFTTEKDLFMFPLNEAKLSSYNMSYTSEIITSSIDLSDNSILIYDTDSVLRYYKIVNDSIRQLFLYKSKESLVLYSKIPKEEKVILCEKNPPSYYSGPNKYLLYQFRNRNQILSISLRNNNKNIIVDSVLVNMKFSYGSRKTAVDDVIVITPSFENNRILIGGGSRASLYTDAITGATISQTILYQIDLEERGIINTFEGHEEDVISAIYITDAKEILSGDAAGFVILWDTETNSPVFKVQISDGWCEISSLWSIPNTRLALCGMENGKIAILDLQNGKVLKVLTGHTSKVLKIFTDNSGKYGFTYSIDQTIKIWDIEKQIELATLVILDNTEWVISTPTGLFDASPGAMDKLYYVAGMETIDLEQLKHRYYQPGLLPMLLGYSNEKLRDVPSFDYVRLFPKKELKIDNGELTIDLTNQGGGIGKVSVFIDNIEIIKDARPGGDQDSSNYEMTIPLALDNYARYYRYDTTNVIKVVAWNAEGYLSSRPDTVHYTPSSKTAKGVEVVPSAKSFSKPHLYGLVVGTSDYAGNEIDLQYAAKDATAFYEAIMLGTNRLFGEENVSLSLLSTDIPGQEPSQENIYKQLMAMRKAGPDDIVVVYFSGHGVNYGGQDGDFYYLTMTADGSDAVHLNDPFFRNRRTISSSELAIELNQIPARKKVLILDACSSGQAANNLLASLKDIPSSQKRALEFTQDATGSHILASSAPNSVSYETNIYRQGLLTYALLKGMRGGQLKKIEESEFIDVEQLLQYAKAEVPSLAKSVSGIQEPIYRIPQGTSFIIGQMTEEDKEKIKLAEPLPVFIPCKFINQDLEQADIDLEEMLNSRLDQLSAKGSGAGIQFIQNTNYPDAYQITGNYSRKGKKVEATYILKKGNMKLGGLQKESGDPNDLAKLAEEIIKTVKETISDK